MKQLLAIEYAKLKKLTSIKIIFLAYMVIIPLWMYFMDFFFHEHPELKGLFTGDDFFVFPHIWKFATYSASFFNVLMGVTVVIITCNEIQFKTMRQNVIDGLRKQDVIISKFLVILAISLLVSFYTFLVGFVMGGIYSGFGNAYNGIDKVVLYFIQTLGYFSFAFLFAIIVKKPALSIIFFIIYFPIETIGGAFLPHVIYEFFPLKIYADLTPLPFFEKLVSQEETRTGVALWSMPEQLRLALAFVYILFFFGLSYFILKKRDL